MKSRTLDYIALTLAVIGAINLGLLGFFQFDLLATVFGGVGSWLTRIVFALVGLAGLYSMSLYSRLDHDEIVNNDM